ncbi:alpha/beta fold hydrolase [Paeniglutamicibacter kerguelensis]|uniref:Acyl-coenzyme A synthetase/AMP-(Fatty) acid ligase/pimeloyl-ACP methyl ester carboxylesterase n=1 Tax=Paeniglutamicibacter kerguelensis TaxID=254788 RepID=A0ABS4XAX9_9MICC|nr:acyl-coenzyme A synthetase/AMP-(fatty) acid ligase/pimeloyl-ACP methyl ester carboxylesterase [Paeniglutamicibacter kerguelensis]
MNGTFPGVNPEWSRRVRVPSTSAADAPGTEHDWHLLDNGPGLEARGIEPRGTLLCVHGNPTWSFLWRSLLQHVEANDLPWRVVAVDQLDMGFSARTGVFRRLADRVNDLGDLTKALSLHGPVTTVGHDWGGIISLGWALEHRDLLSSVVLANTAVHPAGHGLPAALRLATHPAVHGWGTTTSSAFLRTTLALAQPALSPEVHDAFMAPYRGPRRRAGVGNFVADIPFGPTHPSRPALDSISEGIKSLDVPALLLWGPKDPVFSDRYLRDLLDRLPQASVHRFEGASHLLPEDRDVAAPVFDWLTTPPAQAPETAESTETVNDPAAAGYRPMLAEVDARRNDHSAAVVDINPPSTLSWSQLGNRVDALARGLAGIGVRPGDRVSLLVPPGIELTTLIYACLRLGAVIVVADAGLGTAGLGRAIRGAGPGYLVGIDRALAGARIFGWPGVRIAAGPLPAAKRKLLGVAHTIPELLEAGTLLPDGRLGGGAAADTPPVFAPADPDADAAVLFTSGSTGPAKGVVYTHRRLAAMRDTLRDTYGLKAGSGLVAGFAPFALLGPALGATSVTPDMDVTSPRTLGAAALADAAAAIDADTVFASPAALANVLETAGSLDAAQRRSLGKIKLLLSAGAPIPEPLLARVQGIVPAARIHTPYGMTEALPVTDIDLDGIRAAGAGNGVCVGTPVAGAHVAIAALAPDGSVSDRPETRPGITGEILVRAPHVKERYDRLWITQRASSSIPGWHRTGDVGHLDDSGRLWVEGRLGHILRTPSGIATPVSAEHAAESVAGTGRAAIVGVGPAGTQVGVAVLETVPPVRRAAPAGPELATAVRSAVAGAGLDLAAVLVVPALPTDIRHNSKIDRTALAAWAAQTLAGGRTRTP